MVDPRALKIAKLRAKAQSTAFPAEADTFRRKALTLMERDGIPERAVQQALAEIFDGHTGGAVRSRSRPDPAATRRPFERGSMTEAMIWVLEEEDNRALRARELWNFIETRGLYTRSRGLTPWATIAAKLATDPQFERVARGLYRLSR